MNLLVYLRSSLANRTTINGYVTWQFNLSIVLADALNLLVII